MGQLKTQENPFRHSQLHQFNLYHVYILKILNHNLNHRPEKKEKREIELESEKILNILFYYYYYLKGKTDKGNQEGAPFTMRLKVQNLNFHVPVDEFILKRHHQRI